MDFTTVTFWKHMIKYHEKSKNKRQRILYDAACIFKN